MLQYGASTFDQRIPVCIFISCFQVYRSHRHVQITPRRTMACIRFRRVGYYKRPRSLAYRTRSSRLFSDLSQIITQITILGRLIQQLQRTLVRHLRKDDTGRFTLLSRSTPLNRCRTKPFLSILPLHNIGTTARIVTLLSMVSKRMGSAGVHNDATTWC